MRNLTNKGATLRVLTLLLFVVTLVSTPALGSNGNGFESFINSREVIATFYFQTNAEDLSRKEKDRLAETMNELQQAQNRGRLLRVEGFSSSEGNQEKNFILSFFRARAVADIIESKGLTSEVTLTGYGDLQAKSSDPAKERRVEIASYVKPVALQRVRVADNNNAIDSATKPSALSEPAETQIDSYRVDQAIRRKIEDKNKGIADKFEDLRDGSQPGLSQAKEKIQYEDLDGGYTQWRITVDPSLAAKLSKIRTADNKVVNRGFAQWKRNTAPQTTPGVTQWKKSTDPETTPGVTQWKKSTDPETTPGVTQITPVQPPVIDALSIEQAIMEKIGAKPAAPSGEVSQVSNNY